jgi:AcrR family transcriptional regulator
MPITESRRRVILEAMVQVVGTKGYTATSVADVVEEAGASRTTFYKHFEDKHSCFLAAYEVAVERVVGEVVAVCDAERPWRERVRCGLSTIVELFAREPALARTVVVEVAAAGGDARRWHWAVLARFGQLLEAGREPLQGAELPANAGLMSASAAAGLIFDELQRGRPGELPELLPELTFAALVPYVGPRAAVEEMQRVAPSSPSR